MERMKLRSSVPPEEKEKRNQMQLKKQQQALKDKPYVEYKGKIKYCTNFVDCAIVCDSLLAKVTESIEECIVGFDIEWPFDFINGPGKASVIQICTSFCECYVLHLTDCKKLPKSLMEFLSHSNVRLTGVNIKNDIRKLSRDFECFKVEEMLNNCIDSGVQANNVLSVKQRWSMEKLVDHCLQMRINKDKKVRMSKWNKIPLTKEQLKYAATDAYVSLRLYCYLKKLEEIEANNQVDDSQQ